MKVKGESMCRIGECMSLMKVPNKVHGSKWKKLAFYFYDLATSALLKLEIYNRLQGDKLGFFQAGHNCR